MSNAYYYSFIIPEPKDRPILRYGSGLATEWTFINAWVYYFQIMLKYLGYEPDALDGKFGTTTEKAVKDFQADHNLVVDGIVGVNTWATVSDQYDKLEWKTRFEREHPGLELIPMGFGPAVTRQARKPLWWAIILLGGVTGLLGYSLYKK